jgi:hypothetical protein
MAARSFRFERSFTAENPLRSDELLSTERILARLVAEAFVADHPEMFADKSEDVSIIASRLERQCDQGMMTAGEIYARNE